MGRGLKEHLSVIDHSQCLVADDVKDCKGNEALNHVIFNSQYRAMFSVCAGKSFFGFFLLKLVLNCPLMHDGVHPQLNSMKA